ncbi:MAG: YceD family protein [Burkholderiaceae bacterium]
MPVPIPTIDTFELSRSGRRVEGQVVIAQLPRLAEFVTTSRDRLRYDIAGLIDEDGYPAADLHVEGRLQLICQRCNASLDFDLDRKARFRFVATEQELNAFPIEDDEIEMIVGSRNMSVYDWVEDEAILSLPLVPRHGECSAPVKTEGDPSAVTAPNPFAVLLALRDNYDGTKRHN